jgi:6-phosphogluconolactonase
LSAQIKIYKSEGDLFHHAAGSIARLINEYNSEFGRCTFVLSGGSTPRNLYLILGSERFREHVKWDDVYIFWGDERCVPPDNEESNYKMAHDTLLSHLDIPGKNIFRIKTELPHTETAKEYEESLREFFPKRDLPIFDIVLLGLGEDGHTASLFPESQALNESEKWVTDNYVQSQDKWRITMTLPVINNARNIAFLAAGKNKAVPVKEVVVKKNSSMPASLIAPVRGNLTWFLDKDAASMIN